MNKGQIFSIDFLIAMILMIFFLGLLLSLGELQGYERKEARIRYEIASKTEAAIISLVNSPQYACEMDTNSYLAYSLDISKINTMSNDELKKSLGLLDYNLSLLLDNLILSGHDDPLNGKNIYAVDLDILYCNGNISFSDLNMCMNGTCGTVIEKHTLKVKVSK